MIFQQPVLEGLFLKRYKRFFVDFELDGEIKTAHCANTGSMFGLLQDRTPVRVTYTDDPKRKLKYGLQMIKANTSWVGVNTMLPNKLVWEAWEKGSFKHWKKYDSAKREYKLNPKTRLDMALFKNEEVAHFVEIKNVTLAEKNVALFPDSKTERGQKHLKELIELVASGHSAEMLYVVQRTDCDTFSPAKDFDPEYARLLKEAKKAGVKISAYPVEMSSHQVELLTSRQLKIKI